MKKTYEFKMLKYEDFINNPDLVKNACENAYNEDKEHIDAMIKYLAKR